MPKSGYSIYYQFLFHSDDTECKTESTMGRSTTEDSIPHPPTKQKNRTERKNNNNNKNNNYKKLGNYKENV